MGTVDKGLIKMMLKMTPEERLEYTVRTANTVLELRHAFKKAKSAEPGKTDRKPK